MMLIEAICNHICPVLMYCNSYIKSLLIWISPYWKQWRNQPIYSKYQENKQACSINALFFTWWIHKFYAYFAQERQILSLMTLGTMWLLLKTILSWFIWNMLTQNELYHATHYHRYCTESDDNSDCATSFHLCRNAIFTPLHCKFAVLRCQCTPKNGTNELDCCRILPY